MGAQDGSTGASPARPKDKVFLIGFSATGKSHTGRLAAQALGAKFVDMDRLIVQRAGKQIARIFEEDGEGEFRRMERETLSELARARGRRVISTGGGVPVDERNREVMAEYGTTIRLVASPEAIHARLNRNHAKRAQRARRAAVRPMLAKSAEQETSIQRIRDLLAEREDAYAAAADHVLDTEGREPADVAGELVELIRRVAPPAAGAA